MSDDDPLSRYLPIQQVADRLQVGYRTVERMIREGRIAAIKHGGKLRISEQEINDYFARLEAQGARSRASRARTRPTSRPRRGQVASEAEAAAG